jgi:hypothetical protein
MWCLRKWLVVAGAALAAAPAALACGTPGYTYAGIASDSHVYGIGARLTATSAVAVDIGHVAGYVGVGGPNAGPNGADEWIQVGLNGYPGSSSSNLYYEVEHPGGPLRYVELASGLAAGTSWRVAVLEIAGRPNWWRVWVDGRPVSEPVELPGSDGKWRALATAESLTAGNADCNRFGYRFDAIVVAQHPGGDWSSLEAVVPFQSGGLHVFRPNTSTLVARAPAPADG